MRLEITDMSLAEVNALAAEHNLDEAWIVYGDCGSHEVYLTSEQGERDPWGVNERVEP